CLWSNIDKIAGHKRRYNLKMIKDLLMKNGFKILIAKHFFCLILPFLFIRTLLNKKNEDFDEKKSGIKINYLINSVLFILSWIENIILANFLPRIGGSIIVVGRKK
ncbi:MAG: hypothetical protein IMZ60_04470, partial [Actinobacteria bacterium]|nr:hypothetical protein [Actinomycetota bacterium]